MPPNRTKKTRQHVQHPFFPIQIPTRLVLSPSRSQAPTANSADSQTDPKSMSTTPQSLSTIAISSRKSSHIWDHGHTIPDGWQCIYCPQQYSTKTTANAINHLERDHQIPRPGSKISNSQRTLHAPRQIDAGRLRNLIAEWLVDRRHSFVEVESDKFCALVEYINPFAVNKIPKSANTSRADIIKCFEVAKLTIKENLSTARSKIHLSFDLWSSPNYKAMMAIVAHWTNCEFKVETATLGMKEVFGEHKGEYLAPVVHDVLKEYEIENKLGWFMSDNASNNDTMLKHLSQEIQRAGGEGFNVETRRLRCMGHILNLAVKLLLFNGNVSALGKELQEIVADVQEDSPRRTEARKREWRARGVVGRLHNIVIYIRGSIQRRNSYLVDIEIDMKKVPAFMLRLDNDTRWGSTYDMIKSAIKNRERLTIYMQQTPELEEDKLSDQD